MKSRGWVPAGVDRIWDYAASLGGPIWKDHLWYFGSASISDPHHPFLYRRDLETHLLGQLLLQDQRPVQEHHRPVLLQLVGHEQRDHAHLQLLHRDAECNVSPSTFYTAELQHVMGNLLLTGKTTFSKTAYSLHAGDVGLDRDGPTYDCRTPGSASPIRAWTYNYAQSAPKSALPPISMMLAQDEVGRRPYIVAYADYFAEKLLGGDHEFKLGIDFANNKMNREQLLPNQLSIYVNGKDTSFHLARRHQTRRVQVVLLPRRHRRPALHQAPERLLPGHGRPTTS